MKKVMRKKILIGVAVMLFGLMGMVGNSSAATMETLFLTLPEPTTWYPNGTPGFAGYNYVAWAHDDFWSFGAHLMVENQKLGTTAVPSVFPIGTYQSLDTVTGSGRLPIIVENQNGMSNGFGLPEAVKELGGASEFHKIWGLGTSLPVVGTTNTSVPYDRGTDPETTTVGEIYKFINLPNSTANKIPVFGLDMADSQNVPLLYFSGRVYLADPINGQIYTDPTTGKMALWAFDNTAQKSGTEIDTDGNPLHARTTIASGDPTYDEDWPGFTLNGSYDPESYGEALALAGGGHADYYAYAPTMDLSLYPANLIFVTDFTVKNPLWTGRYDNDDNKIYYGTGKTEIFILGTPYADVPEPTTLLLLGLGLVGLAGVRRGLKE